MSMDGHKSSGPTRRQVLRAGIGVAAVGVAGIAAPAPATAWWPSPRFDLTDPAEDLFRHKVLKGNRVMQSFAFDLENYRLFTVQVSDGSASEKAGHLTVTRLDFAGNYTGHMYLQGFGHGVSIGVEPDGADSYLWTETDARTEGDSSRGTRLARFRFVNGGIATTSPGLPRFQPVDRVTTYAMTCAIDPVNRRMAVRHRLDADTGAPYMFAIYRLDDVKERETPIPLAELPTPPGIGVFQGYTLYGDYLYLYEGTAKPADNTYITSVDIHTGEKVERFHSHAGLSLSHREPEGLAIYRTKAGEPRLFQGIASGEVGDRRANLFYKNRLVW